MLYTDVTDFMHETQYGVSEGQKSTYGNTPLSCDSITTGVEA
jgi:hypothetical protein